MMTGLRKIASKHSSPAYGPITRVISPDAEGLGELLKPFIFLDYFNASIRPGFGFPMHPHSGIATLTWQPGCDVQYEDTTGKNGVLKAGGLEWMNAGGGAWHRGTLMGNGHVTGFQLWVPMPPDIEDGPSIGQYVPPEEVPVVPISGGDVKVLLGELDAPQGAARSPIKSHQNMNYLVLTLEPGARWRYEPPSEHNVAWAFGFEGDPAIQGVSGNHELVVFDQSDGAIEFIAEKARSRVLIGSAERHGHALVLGQSSVHTNDTSLRLAQERIHELRQRIQMR